MTIRIGLVGLGKIAQDQHVPALAANADYELVAVASRNASLDGVAHYRDVETLLAECGDLDAVSLCTPPQVRSAQARAALAAGKHVMLEKPPGATLSEVIDLETRARDAGRTLYASWHSRQAPAVEPARAWLAERRVEHVEITWKEDVRVWHPGQQWIWQPGGLGVFDPGINALSIATRVLPRPFFVTGAQLSFPENRAAPIAATLDLVDDHGGVIRGVFDFRQTGPQTWNIDVRTNDGRLLLSEGGSRMHVNDEPVDAAETGEYPGLYEEFAQLVEQGRSDVDISPLRLVADSFLLGQRETVEAFHDSE